MRILITGGFGFVGGRIAQHLQQVGHQIVLASRNTCGPPDWLPQAEVVKAEWNDSVALQQICNGVDVVIHAAGMNAQDCLSNPIAALEFNGLATARLVASASRTDVKRFIYLSTAHVYASPLIGAISEETCPRNLHPYATSHLAGEDAVLSASQRWPIEGIVLRLTNAYGAPTHKEVNCWMLLVNDLCKQAVQSGKMVLRSSGQQQRDFIPLEDVVSAVRHLLDLPAEQCGDGLFNLGGGASLSVLEMTQRIAARCQATLGFSPEIVRPESAMADQAIPLRYDCEKIYRSGFRLKNTMEQELDNTLVLCSQAWSQSER